VIPASLEDDFRRRDFTVNAMACWISGPEMGKLLDPLKGQPDLAAKQIRALHAKSFEDDPTRIYRAARFAGRFGFQVEPGTLEWIRAAIREKRPAALSAVRRRHEFELVLKEENPAPALTLLQSWGALELVHSDWKNIPASQFTFTSQPVLEDRLVEWFSPWGREQATRMMNDLSFEKATKLSVLSKLVQSRPHS